MGGLGSGRRPYGGKPLTVSYHSHRISDIRRGWWEPPAGLRIVTTPQPFGGMCEWFLCPCGRRCAVLYAPTSFLNGGLHSIGDLWAAATELALKPPTARDWKCRVCYGLAYESQRQSLRLRSERRGAKLRQRVGSFWDWIDGREAVKLKGVHWSTYERTLREARRHEIPSLMFMDCQLDRFIDRVTRKWTRKPRLRRR